MKRLFLFLLPVMLFACSSEPEADESSSDQGGQFGTQGEIQICHCDELVKEEGLRMKDGKPFTGICRTFYEDSVSVLTELHVLNGKPHGNFVVYDRDGKVLSSQSYGELKAPAQEKFRTCDCTDLVVEDDPNLGKVATLDSTLFTGWCSSNYPGSEQKYIEETYRKGLKHGKSLVYGKNGALLQTEEYEMGQPVR